MENLVALQAAHMRILADADSFFMGEKPESAAIHTAGRDEPLSPAQRFHQDRLERAGFSPVSPNPFADGSRSPSAADDADMSPQHVQRVQLH
jgi:hypothetical protein